MTLLSGAAPPLSRTASGAVLAKGSGAPPPLIRKVSGAKTVEEAAFTVLALFPSAAAAACFAHAVGT